MAGSLSITHISPVPENLNPYVHLLASSLNRVGARCEVKNRFSLRWLLAARRPDLDVLHFHWAEHLCSRSSPDRTLKDSLQFLAGLLYAKAVGYRLVYTVHNVDPHDRDGPTFSLVAHRVLLALADGLHAHDEHGLVRLRKMSGGRKPVFLVPHGHYIGAYPNHCSRMEARARLGIEDDVFAYLFLGQMRPHKGIEDLLNAFRRVANARDRLVLAGWAPQGSYGSLLQQMSDGDPRIRVFRQFVPNEDLQFFLNACDVSVLPYRTVTTSGAAILSISFGRPVVAPGIGGFTHLFQDGGGLLYDPEGEGLSLALRRAKDLDLQAASSEALALARRLEWGPIACKHLDAYRTLL